MAFRFCLVEVKKLWALQPHRYAKENSRRGSGTRCLRRRSGASKAISVLLTREFRSCPVSLQMNNFCFDFVALLFTQEEHRTLQEERMVSFVYIILTIPTSRQSPTAIWRLSTNFVLCLLVFGINFTSGGYLLSFWSHDGHYFPNGGSWSTQNRGACGASASTLFPVNISHTYTPTAIYAL